MIAATASPFSPWRTPKRHRYRNCKESSFCVLERHRSELDFRLFQRSCAGISILSDLNEFKREMRIGKVSDWAGKEAMQFRGMSLKPMQIAILKCNRLHDVLVNLPTGFGKSLLFQYPASLLQDKCIVVFVPLKALLWDCLKEAELHGLTAVECDSAFIRKHESHGFLPQLLFLTPERLFMNQTVMGFLDCLNAERKVEMFVIDEAHCISEWGSDFRPDYARLGELRTLFPGTRLLGMSATIPPEALKDLIARLQIPGCYYFQSSSNRPNLIYEVISTEKGRVAGSVLDYIKAKGLEGESGIIYCQTIKNAEEVMKDLQKYDLSCCLFHSKLPERKREENFDGFMSGRIKCIVATICFGMGVNKKNIRYVINVGVSLSAENYYQESGRAGRDGEISYCLLLTYSSDLAPLQYLINQATKKKALVKRRLYKLQQLKVYTKARDCRKRTLFKLLGEQFDAEKCRRTCDFCMKGLSHATLYETVDYSEKGFMMVEEMQRFRESVTKLQLVGFLKGKDCIKNKITREKYRALFQMLKEERNENIEQLVETMVARGLLVPHSEKVKIGKITRFVEYLKPCTKTELQKQRQQGLRVEVAIANKRPEPKSNKEHIPNPYVGQKFKGYLERKAKSLDPLDFETEFDKNQTRPAKLQEEEEPDEEMKEIKLVEIGPDIERFFDQIFPEHANVSADEIKVEDLDPEEIMGLESAEMSKEDLQEELEAPLSVTHSKPPGDSQFIIPEHKPAKQQPETKNQVSKKEESKKGEDSSDDDSLFQMIREKREQLRRRSQKIGNEVVRRKLTARTDFL